LAIDQILQQKLLLKGDNFDCVELVRERVWLLTHSRQKSFCSILDLALHFRRKENDASREAMASATAALVSHATLARSAVHSSLGTKTDVSRASNTTSAPLKRSFDGLHSHQLFSTKASLGKCAASSRKNGGSAALAVQAVAAPAIRRGAEVEFDTEVFKKEKITLAGGDEVWLHLKRAGIGLKGLYT
jgi:hypothetical protein